MKSYAFASSRKGQVPTLLWSLPWLGVLTTMLVLVVNPIIEHYIVDRSLYDYGLYRSYGYNNPDLFLNWVVGVGLVLGILSAVLVNVYNFVAGYKNALEFHFGDENNVNPVALTSWHYRLFGGLDKSQEVVDRIMKIEVLQSKFGKIFGTGTIVVVLVRMVNVKAEEHTFSLLGVSNPASAMEVLARHMTPNPGMLLELKK